jgi:hemerythrin-like domain-containing protein
MLGMLLGGGRAMKLLKKDHDNVKDLFDRFEASEDGSEKARIARQACEELKIHARIEEELFYPALRQRLNDKSGILDEADEEHHEAKILIAELGLMNGGEPNFSAKFLVLAENVRHHIEEEESEIFPAARKTELDFDELGQRMERRKAELLREGVPPEPEAEMVKTFGLLQESPSRKAMKTLVLPDAAGKRGRARKH